MPAPPVDIDPRHVFLTAKEVILRYGGRTDGYLMLRSTASPPDRRPLPARHPDRLGTGRADRSPPRRRGRGPGVVSISSTADPQTSEGPWRIRVPAPR